MRDVSQYVYSTFNVNRINDANLIIMKEQHKNYDRTKPFNIRKLCEQIYSLHYICCNNTADIAHEAKYLAQNIVKETIIVQKRKAS